MPTLTVDLTAINQQSEIVVRGGDVTAPDGLLVLRKAYEVDPDYPDVVGLSVLFRVGASVDALARANPLRNAKLSYGPVARISAELAHAGYAPVLYVTPALAFGLPDHHTLAFARLSGGLVVPAPLPDDAGLALIRALSVGDNAHRRARP